MATKKPRNKPYVRQDCIIRDMNYLYSIMNKNMLYPTEKNIKLLMWGLHHTFYCAELLCKTANYKKAMEYLNPIKVAFERVLIQIVKKSFTSLETGHLNCDSSIVIKQHHLTRGKIMYFCKNFNTTHHLVDIKTPSQAKAMQEAKFMADCFLKLRNSPARAFVL